MRSSLRLFLLLLWGCVEDSLTQKGSSVCQMPPDLEGGVTKHDVRLVYSHNEQVEYMCQEHHIMEGGAYKTCVNGEWTGEMRCFKPCIVTTESMSNHNIGFRFGRHDKLYSHHNDAIQFRCTTGTKHSGTVGLRQRCTDGTLLLPTCL
uniref:complement factor H like 5 n=1 Tax=Doryrhamphus excisus TaxID=161450 RepID=UPI0025ADEED9|nr:complement factor H like 5 [Doryrhamphus excisus]